MKATITRYYTLVFLLLLQVAVLAQFRPPAGPVSLKYRQGNTNTLNLIVSSAGQIITPSASTTMTAEIRLSEAAQVLRALPLQRVDTTDYLYATLPDLAPTRYVMNLKLAYANGRVYRSGICYVEIIPAGSIISVPDVTGLNVTLDMRTQVLDIKLDAGPAVALVQYYAMQAQAARDSIRASDLLTPADLVGINTAIASLQTTKLNTSTYQTDLANTTLSLSQKLLTTTFTAYLSTQSTRDAGQDTQINTKLPASFSVTQATRDSGQDDQINTKLPASYSVTQAGRDSGQDTDIGSRVLASTYTTNRTADQAATGNAQTTATQALTISQGNQASIGTIQIGKGGFYIVTTTAAADALSVGTEPKLIMIKDAQGNIVDGYIYIPGSPKVNFLTL